LGASSVACAPESTSAGAAFSRTCTATVWTGFAWWRRAASVGSLGRGGFDARGSQPPCLDDGGFGTTSFLHDERGAMSVPLDHPAARLRGTEATMETTRWSCRAGPAARSQRPASWHTCLRSPARGAVGRSRFHRRGPNHHMCDQVPTRAACYRRPLSAVLCVCRDGTAPSSGF
jgi:hypothetical protein